MSSVLIPRGQMCFEVLNTKPKLVQHVQRKTSLNMYKEISTTCR